MNNKIKMPGRPVLARAMALLFAVGLAGGLSGQALASPLQCVPYARDHSGIDIHGNAWTWWEQARGVYARGSSPKIGAVMTMAPSQAMPLGHVAVVEKIVDSRHILLDHANWSGPGKIDRGALAEDVSAAGDWSEVRVYYAPSGGLGSRTNPVFGFIYAEASSMTETTIAAAPADDDMGDAG
ncbi:CHAP domain-containing protein [Novosphingobium sp. BL-8A]|uniref:CHAP domain-containing protein n=1 Tax=Novosphingobium sp. BL-8A TaxID=3127639 RepID=UPI00375776D5